MQAANDNVVAGCVVASAETASSFLRICSTDSILLCVRFPESSCLDSFSIPLELYTASDSRTSSQDTNAHMVNAMRTMINIRVIFIDLVNPNFKFVCKRIPWRNNYDPEQIWLNGSMTAVYQRVAMHGGE